MTALLPLVVDPRAVVPLLDLPGLLLAPTGGPEHQLARVESFPAAEPGAADLDLIRCRCAALLTPAAFELHRNDLHPDDEEH